MHLPVVGEAGACSAAAVFLATVRNSTDETDMVHKTFL